MAKRKCLLTFYPTKCEDDCFNCGCGGAEATKDMYVSINNVQRVCSITAASVETKAEAYIAEIIRNNLETMIDPEAQPLKHGRWIWDSNAPHREHGAYKCSNCGCHSDFEENYCYNCGARMDLKDGDTNG